jgi:anti-sigma regulatory factor (Ser/Thr protein kinase)
VPDFHHEITISNDLAHLARVREVVSRSVKDGGFPGQYVNRLQIAVDEAVTNIIEHGYEGQPAGKGAIWITVDVSKDRFRIEIADNGTSFDPNTLGDVDIVSHVKSGNTGGLGVFLMRKIMDVVDYRFEVGVKNRLVLVKNR